MSRTSTKLFEVVTESGDLRKLREEALERIVGSYTDTINYFDRFGKMQKEIEDLQRTVALLRQSSSMEYLYRKVSNEGAEEEIKEYLIEQKNKGVSKISLGNIVDSLRLPPEQIECIMHDLKSQGVKDVE